MTTLNGMAIQVSAFLTGSQKAVFVGRTLHVSPAMYDLISHAEGDELRRVLAAIPCLMLPALPSIYDPLPMTPWSHP